MILFYGNGVRNKCGRWIILGVEMWLGGGVVD